VEGSLEEAFHFLGGLLRFFGAIVLECPELLPDASRRDDRSLWRRPRDRYRSQSEPDRYNRYRRKRNLDALGG